MQKKSVLVWFANFQMSGVRKTVLHTINYHLTYGVDILQLDEQIRYGIWIFPKMAPQLPVSSFFSIVITRQIASFLLPVETNPNFLILKTDRLGNFLIFRRLSITAPQLMDGSERDRRYRMWINKCIRKNISRTNNVYIFRAKRFIIN